MQFKTALECAWVNLKNYKALLFIIFNPIDKNLKLERDVSNRDQI